MVGIAGALSAFYTLRRSIRVAGPLYRLGQVLQRMTQGKYRPARFRDGDEFREFEGLTHRLARRMEILSKGNVNLASRMESRLVRLKARLEVEDVPKETLQKELDGILAELEKPHAVAISNR